jgi:hypothetical protein
MNRVGVPNTWPEARPLSTSWRIRSATAMLARSRSNTATSRLELGGVPEQIAVSSAFRRWNSDSRVS